MEPRLEVLQIVVRDALHIQKLVYLVFGQSTLNRSKHKFQFLHRHELLYFLFVLFFSGLHLLIRLYFLSDFFHDRKFILDFLNLGCQINILKPVGEHTLSRLLLPNLVQLARE